MLSPPEGKGAHCLFTTALCLARPGPLTSSTSRTVNCWSLPTTVSGLRGLMPMAECPIPVSSLDSLTEIQEIQAEPKHVLSRQGFGQNGEMTNLAPGKNLCESLFCPGTAFLLSLKITNTIQCLSHIQDRSWGNLAGFIWRPFTGCKSMIRKTVACSLQQPKARNGRGGAHSGFEGM